MLSSIDQLSRLAVAALCVFPTVLAVGINAGTRIIYTCSERDFAHGNSSKCINHDIPYELRNGGFVRLHSAQGFMSIRPDPSLEVDVWSQKHNSGDFWLVMEGVRCPGGNIRLHGFDVTMQDLWLRVCTLDRKTLPKKLWDGCDFSQDGDTLNEDDDGTGFDSESVGLGDAGDANKADKE
jgi:hypothetical protein